MVNIRRYEDTDCNAVADLFYNTVHTINAQDYSSEQLDVWASGNIDLEQWNQSFKEHFTLVAVCDGIIVGFGDISVSGYLDRLFVHADYQGRGVGSAICEKLEEFVQQSIITHVSITAKTFFLQRGYEIVKEQIVERQGVGLKNFVMIKKR